MTLRHFTTRASARLAAGALVSAAATAALVGAGAGAAHAAGPTATTAYDCSALGSSQGSFPLTLTLGTAAPATAPAGYPVPAGALAYTGSLALNASQAGLLNSAGVDGGTSADFAFGFGAGKVSAPATFGKPVPTTGGAAAIPVSGANTAFQLPAAGTAAVTMPTSFTIAATKQGAPLVNLVCTAPAGASLGSATLSKQASTTKAKAAKTIKAGAKGTIKVKVANEFVKQGGIAPTGKLFALDGKKTVGTGKIKNGKATIKLKKLTAGKHSIVVVYQGDSYDSSSASKPLSITQK